MLTDHRQLRTALVSLRQALELPIDQLEAARDLLPTARPALLPVAELVFGNLATRAGLIEVLVQSQ